MRFLSATLAWVIIVVLIALNPTPASAVRNAFNFSPMPAGKVDPRMLAGKLRPGTPAGKVDPCKSNPKANPACDPFWEDVAVKYSPQYKFHPLETIWPITIDEYLKHVTASKGFYTAGGKQQEVTYQEGPITLDNLNTLLENVNLKSEFKNTVLWTGDKLSWASDPARNPKNGGTKLYTVIYNPKPGDKNSFVEIQYWLFYPYNYVNRAAGDSNHVSDLVAIAIRFSKTGQPQRIWYAQHGHGPVWAWDQGADWADKKSKKKFATVLGTLPIVYVSKDNHEHYTGVGDFNCIVLCFDRTANGLAWAPFDNPKSAFEFVHVKSEMSDFMPNAARAKLFTGRNKWMAFNGKLGGFFAKMPFPYTSGLKTGVSAISSRRTRGSSLPN
ncbi:unnamed protein product [Closterium sp. Yama58-4]|nr:unnamed protein product [Closterium sp. Yama58-4]